MPSAPIHSSLTRSLIRSLAPALQVLPGSEIEAICADYCLYPDTYYGDPLRTEPYLCFIDGIPFHYLPNEPVECNNWRMEMRGGVPKLVATPLSENIHHRHCRVGLTFYFEKISAALLDARISDAAQFMGALCHVLEDNTLPIHAVEGFDGMDVFALDRLVEPPEGKRHSPPSLLLAGVGPVDVGAFGDPPACWGPPPPRRPFMPIPGFPKWSPRIAF